MFIAQGSNYSATCLPSRKLSKLDKPDTQDTAGEAGISSEVMYSYGPPQKQDNRLEHAYSSYVRIRDVALKAGQRQWTIGRSSERGSGISVLAARHDEDDEDDDYLKKDIRPEIIKSQNVKSLRENILLNKKWINSILNSEPYSSFEWVPSYQGIFSAKLLLHLRRNEKWTAKTICHNLSSLTNWDISDIVTVRNKFDTFQERLERDNPNY